MSPPTAYFVQVVGVQIDPQESTRGSRARSPKCGAYQYDMCAMLGLYVYNSGKNGRKDHVFISMYSLAGTDQATSK